MKPGQIRRVLVALRPRQRGLPAAADHARVLAERFGADLTVMSAVYDSSVALGASRGNARSAAARDGIVEAEKASLERLASSLRDWGIAVETDVRWHAPTHEAVLQVVSEKHVDLLVVDALESQPAVHTRLTDADWQLMRRCPCPLLFVNDPEFASYDTILAAVDPLHPGPATERTDAAVLSTAAAFARAFGAQLRVLHVYPDPEVYSWVSSIEVSPGVFLGAENIEAFHRQAVEALVSSLRIGADRVDLRPGDPRVAIADAAADCHAGLVVLGALARGEIEQALLGSTAEAIAAEADCDVLLVKPAPAVAV
ncbi:MAG: universal stress protein [Gammaproteobacteria bacterium]|nr:universal stress protein [Gammaproteobacteria bacterium]